MTPFKEESPFNDENDQYELEHTAAQDAAIPWKVLVVDDDEEVHRVTRWVLRNFTFEGRPVELISAFSSMAAQSLLVGHSDLAVVLLDVVMEKDDDGLKLAHFIRNDLKNSMIRIILRTGHPGQAPELKVMTDYDINDYKEKTELTAQKLQTSLMASLRAYRDLSIIDNNRRGLHRVIESLSSIYEFQSMSKLASGLLSQVTALLNFGPNAFYAQANGFAITREQQKGFRVMAACGSYEHLMPDGSMDALSAGIKQEILAAFYQKKSRYLNNCIVIYSNSKGQSESIVYMEGLGSINEWDQVLLEIFFANVATAFDNLYLNREIEDTQKEIIFILGEIAEARSLETGQHVKRVSEYAWFLAHKMGYSEDNLELLRMAAPIHDLGKIGIPDTILNKPAKLTPAEYELIKKHTLIGYEMLKKSDRPILKTGAIIALQHHEFWNGQGYPHGLKGEEISCHGRIVALADVFDALGVDRVYKKAWPLPDIIEYIKSQRGLQFEPRLVDILIQNQEQFIEITRAFPDVHAESSK